MCCDLGGHILYVLRHFRATCRYNTIQYKKPKNNMVPHTCFSDALPVMQQ